MKRTGLHLKMMSALFALALTLLLPHTKTIQAESLTTQALSGTLTVSGHATVDGKSVQTGTTVFSESFIETEPDGDVTIDCGALGRIQMRPNTKIQLHLAPGSCHAFMNRCGSITQQVPAGVTAQIRIADAKYVQVSVKNGQVGINREIKKQNGETEMEKVSLRGKSNKKYYYVKEVNAENESSFTVRCCQCCFVEKTRH